MSDEEKRGSLAGRLARSWILWGSLGAATLATILALTQPLFTRGSGGLPVLLALPSFQLTEQRGRPFGSAELAGRVWIANFIFTSCRTICPRLTAQMARIQERLRPHGDAVHLVSVSVDPRADTPPILAAYARRHGADDDRWSFLTGSQEAVERLVRNGFHQTMDPMTAREQGPEGEKDLLDIAHASSFVLVDRRGRIRGHYDSDGPGLLQIIHDAAELLAEPR
jgi:protein SCO1/2